MISRIIPLLVLAVAFSPTLSAAAPSDRELIAAIERQIKGVMNRSESAMALIVVSRSMRYPNPPSATETPGKLGDFDRAKFLLASPAKSELASRLDLSNRGSIPDNAYGCGVVISSEGQVLTLYHVIEGATKIYVRLPGGKGSYADILAADARSDLAVLKLLHPPAGLKAVSIAEVRTPPTAAGRVANVERGSFAVLMSNMYDSTHAEQPTGSMAFITGVHERPPERAVDDPQSRMWSLYQYAPLLQYSNQFPLGPFAGRPLKLNLGTSGGALLNLDGELIGLTTTASPLAAGNEAAGYALPMDEFAHRAIDVLKRGEEIEYGFLGVSSSSGAVPPGQRGRGLLVSNVSANSPADAAGIQDYDVIRQVNGHTVESHKDLFMYVGSLLAGGRAKIRVERTIRRPAREAPTDLNLVAVLGKYQHGMPFIASVRPEPVFGLRVEYSSVLIQKPLGNDIAPRIPAGVIVRELVPGSPAEAKFKPLNDVGGPWVITQVNGTAISTPAEFYAAARGKNAVTLSLTDPTASPTRSREITLP